MGRCDYICLFQFDSELSVQDGASEEICDFTWQKHSRRLSSDDAMDSFSRDERSGQSGTALKLRNKNLSMFY